MTTAGSIAARSFGGCDTCRSRRVKCDETRPTCLLCSTTGLTCRGYGKNIFFTPGADGSELDGEDFRFRRLLFTEAERQEMSQWLTSSVSPSSVSKQLSALDEQCENVSPDQSMDVQHGPFGVFRGPKIAETRFGSADSVGELDWCRDIRLPDHDNEDDNVQQSMDQGDAQSCQWSPSLIAAILDDPLQFSSPTEPGHINMASAMDNTDAIAATECEAPAMLGLSETALCLTEGATLESPSSITSDNYLGYMLNPDLGTIEKPSHMSVAPTVSMPGDAVFLLKHYVSSVVNFVTPFGHAKTPWHTLFIPHVKTCLAALTMGEHLSHASSAVFFGTLAISASSLGRKMQSHSSMWLERSKFYERQAREHCRATLASAYHVPKVAKYKTILMALLTLVHLYTVTGRRACVDFYFVEAEKFIRLKGLSRKKSRKVRLLHHCYVFQRLFYESLCIGKTSSHRKEVQNAIESSELIIYSQDSPSFKALSNWHDPTQQTLYIKTQEEGENDLHLEHPGVWPATLYPEIYGIPEGLIYFLSCTIRLGKEKDAMDQGHGSSSINMSEFFKRARTLERCIKQFPDWTSEMRVSEADFPGDEKLANMIIAVRNALAIYFYRRIYDIDAELLQSKVLRVLNALRQVDCTGSDGPTGSLSLVWPGFIAACEAESPPVQQAFSEWFENCAHNSGLDTFSITIRTIREVWVAKSSLSDTGASWIDLAKGKTYAGLHNLPL
ncbi:hypothetical protein PFICI_00207 [Pestalotiopsis fici W106-1]|uniref:Zn(2)-C6 fungal-type domain-containing protein n=1 Tax=Pestalotiopsis fici (strain W106-1 / CGMCC3.15140) TaxID=1229662 RepID=W3XK32_PESFW|nr:uncharacterized protein PFICI_00207 [Pestalotiopsis fici W106-1]ETS86379.1 hypothetical protein PFICI_00207 [Pestalotiopsis fici W106-1]